MLDIIYEYDPTFRLNKKIKSDLTNELYFISWNRNLKLIFTACPDGRQSEHILNILTIIADIPNDDLNVHKDLYPDDLVEIRHNDEHFLSEPFMLPIYEELMTFEVEDEIITIYEIIFKTLVVVAVCQKHEGGKRWAYERKAFQW